MKKIKLIVADHDAAFLQSFGEYVLSSDAQHQFDLKLCTSEESLGRYLESDEHFDLILLKPELYKQEQLQSFNGIILYLEEAKKNIETNQQLFKYQSITKLLSDMLSLYYEQNKSLDANNGTTGRTSIIGFYSATGGAGKTTLAANMSRQLAIMGKKIFYLNFEVLNSRELYFRSDEDKPSLEVFYYLKAKPHQLMSKVETLKKHDPLMNVDYFDWPTNPEEMLEASKDEILKLIQAISATDQYDYILIDMDSSFQVLSQAAFAACDQLFWLLNNDMQSFHKTNELLKNLDQLLGKGHGVQEKIEYIVNRFTGHVSEPFITYDFAIKGYLPYVQEWNPLVDRDQMMSHPHYTQELLAIIRGLVETSKEGAPNG